MKGKIGKFGQLELERKGKMVVQYCPFAPHELTQNSCGTWCPHFGEPTDCGSARYNLEITCGYGRLFIFDEFIEDN